MNDKIITDNLIVKLSFDFSLNLIVYVVEQNRKFVIANQLLKSGQVLEQYLESTKCGK